MDMQKKAKDAAAVGAILTVTALIMLTTAGVGWFIWTSTGVIELAVLGGCGAYMAFAIVLAGIAYSQ
jgi:hypothetical protein